MKHSEEAVLLILEMIEIWATCEECGKMSIEVLAGKNLCECCVESFF